MCKVLATKRSRLPSKDTVSMRKLHVVDGQVQPLCCRASELNSPSNYAHPDLGSLSLSLADMPTLRDDDKLGRTTPDNAHPPDLLVFLISASFGCRKAGRLRVGRYRHRNII